MAKYQDTLELIDKVSQPLKKIQGNMQKVSKIALNAGKVIAGIGATITSVSGAVIAGANKFADYGDRIDKMSQKIGMSRKAFQEWDYIMSQNGGSVDTLQMGFKTLATQMGNVTKGNKQSVSAFNKLGVSVKDSTGKLRSQDEVFNDTVRALQRMKNPTEKAILANQLFGRSALEMKPLLNQEADAIDNLRNTANKKGLIISDEDINNAVKYKDTMDTFSRFFEAKFATVMMGIMPSITQSLDQIVALVEENQDALDSIGISLQWIFTTAMPLVIKAVVGVANAFQWLGGFIGNIIGAIITIPDKISMAFNTAKTNIMIFFINIKKQVMEVIKLIQSIFNLTGNLGGLFSGMGRMLKNAVTNNNSTTNNTTNNSTVNNYNTTNNYGIGAGALSYVR